MSYKLSVIIPVFNAEDYIKECLDSVVDQSLGIDNIEVIIVNDNSCDSTLDIISQYTDKYPSFKLISNKSNLGPGESRNMALKEVSSDYVTYLDADDFISQNAYEDALSKINEFNADLLIYNWETYTGSDYVEPINIHQQNTLENKLITDIKQNPKLFLSTAPWNKIYHRSLFKYLKFSKGFYEDNIVAILALINAKRIFLSKDSIYYYRKNSDSTTENITVDSSIHLSNSIKEIFDLRYEYPEFLNDLKLLNINFIYDILFWTYYYNWALADELKIINKLKSVIIPLKKEDIDRFKQLFPDKLSYEKDILDLDKYDAETFLAKYKYFNRLNKVNSQASLYVDTGKGFNESDKVAIDYSPLKKNNLEFSLENFGNISKLRFDPLEGSFIKCRITNNLPISDANCDNSVDDDYQIFTNLDPCYVLDADFSDISSIQINFDLEILTNNDIANLFRQKDNIINDLQVKPKKRKFSFFNKKE
ncbi:MAG: glycosyltransferase family 2 protein [Methanobrevibacter smithii]|jgi:glycosyltransferase involved in cell wall biosynthesis|uniref:Glycosyltransferase, group 2 family protein n=1 Tax=Methanobrevibacter smithii DSM 2374 TaxID=521002 RepID=D2ZNR9_METSM|nr:glycosyltransferase family 2 protein [Methanobrevibacter smithii]EFC92916.1 glycosyltransferase, group 2 family protein [Methanobrevibacter smithii DSM 2374]